MSEIPSSEAELDDYCHTLYQEKVSLHMFGLTIIHLACRTNYCVNTTRKESLMLLSMNGRASYDERFYHT